jgi:hypothetical protein
MSVRPVPASWLEPIRGAGRRNSMRLVLSQAATVLVFVSGCVLTAAGCSVGPGRQVTADSVRSSVNNSTPPPLKCVNDAYVEGSSTTLAVAGVPIISQTWPGHTCLLAL